MVAGAGLDSGYLVRLIKIVTPDDDRKIYLAAKIPKEPKTIFSAKAQIIARSIASKAIFADSLLGVFHRWKPSPAPWMRSSSLASLCELPLLILQHTVWRMLNGSPLATGKEPQFACGPDLHSLPSSSLDRASSSLKIEC